MVDVHFDIDHHELQTDELTVLLSMYAEDFEQLDVEDDAWQAAWDEGRSKKAWKVSRAPSGPGAAFRVRVAPELGGSRGELRGDAPVRGAGPSRPADGAGDFRE